MRISLVSGLVCLMALAGCGGGVLLPDRDVNHAAVCQQQSDYARAGKVPTGEIAISCPAHGIGDYQ